MSVQEVEVQQNVQKDVVKQDQKSFMEQYRQWKSESCQWLNVEVSKPAQKYYAEIPQSMTSLKKQYIFNHGSQNQRLILVGVTTSLISLSILRKQMGFRRAIRDTVIAYFGLGLFLAPEVYNPLLKQNN